jgi:hypothetical protein
LLPPLLPLLLLLPKSVASAQRIIEVQRGLHSPFMTNDCALLTNPLITGRLAGRLRRSCA